MTEDTHNIEALCDRSRAISLEKGWLNPDGTDPRPFHTVIGLFHTELSEAFEDIRDNKGLNEVWYELKGVRISKEERVRSVEPLASDVGAFKPCGFPIEVADFVIRVAQYCGSTGNAEKLSRIIDTIREKTFGERRVAENAELLITQLHADCSLGFVVAMGGFRGAGIPTDPIHYLATGVLTAFDFCQKHDINLWGAIDEKEAYNRTRPTKHGGKKH